ncbi:MAG TPA: hypothetical protein VM166_13085 [Gemmatimonadaceae bacterium]|nr:hypothetical protein [Gemmatimonadaceae bacterium]
MKYFIRTAALGLLLVAAAALPTRAQLPTPEGTVITNVATVNYTDANGNAYAPVTASVSVTIGFVPGIDVVQPSPLTSTTGSTGNQAVFTITNNGNGTDQFNVSSPVVTGVVITGYIAGGVTYPNLDALNAALAGTNVASGGSVTVTVVYSVPADLGGTSQTITLTANSVRATSTTDNGGTTITVPLSEAVVVTPDGATVNQVPTASNSYTFAYTVTNTGNAQTTYSLGLTASDASVLPGFSLSQNSVTLAVGQSATITATYTVGNVAAGASSSLVLTATSSVQSSSDTGSLTVSLIKPSLSMAKQAFRADGATLIGASDKVVPGETVIYKVSVTNNGTSAANNVVVTDALPAGVTYVSSSGDAAGWTITGGANLSATLSGSLGIGATRYVTVTVTIK